MGFLVILWVLCDWCKYYTKNAIDKYKGKIAVAQKNPKLPPKYVLQLEFHSYKNYINSFKKNRGKVKFEANFKIKLKNSKWQISMDLCRSLGKNIHGKYMGTFLILCYIWGLQNTIWKYIDWFLLIMIFKSDSWYKNHQSFSFSRHWISYAFLLLIEVAKIRYVWGFTIIVGLSPSKKNCVFCFIESPLKVMKNAFYFILKALFVLEIFKFLSWRFVM